MLVRQRGKNTLGKQTVQIRLYMLVESNLCIIVRWFTFGIELCHSAFYSYIFRVEENLSTVCALINPIPSVKRWHTTHRILGGKYNVIVVYPARDINSARHCIASARKRDIARQSTEHTTQYTAHTTLFTGIWMFYIYMKMFHLVFAHVSQSTS